MTKKNDDWKWKSFNEDLQKYMKENDFYRLGATYYGMAALLEEEGKNSDEVRELGYEMKLKNQKDQLNSYTSVIVSRVQVIACPGSSCSDCVKLHDVVISLTDAKNKNILPVRTCQFIGGCRCVYVPIVN